MNTFFREVLQQPVLSHTKKFLSPWLFQGLNSPFLMESLFGRDLAVNLVSEAIF